MKYNPQKIERKWQKYWASKKFYNSKDAVAGKENFMLLTEFPYPSGNLHIGHWYAFAIPDIYARYLRMNGKNVSYPMGFDAFGLPAENAAIKNNTDPRDWTEKNIAYMTKQLKSMGAVFDWPREVRTIDPEYYKWTQWLFLKFYEKGLAYRAPTLVNWCPKDKTVLANEQVVDGKCERDGEPVIQKEITQWMFRITDYADRLIDDLSGLDWPETTKTAQKNWIGRSEGASTKFPIFNSQFSKGGQEYIEVFTTRADTLFGATYLVIAPEHPMVMKLTDDRHLDGINKYLEEAKRKTEIERAHLDKSKTGVFTGGFVLNPINNEKIPVWVADYVVGWYGTGAVMAVPAHDERDWEFAKKFNLPIKQVVQSGTKIETEKPTEEDGVLIDSGKFSGMQSAEARKKIIEELKTKGLADFKKNYKLHDWVLSRQRYWGVPIPMIHCAHCGYQPVPEKDLPIKLPKLDDFKPSDDSPRLSSGEAGGRSPLAKAENWVKVKCPKCGREGERETDTMDTFVDSSWYFLRYSDPKNKKEFASQDKMAKWLPVPLYIGGAEHNTMHLLYSRFYIKALYDLGYVNFNEPFLKRVNRGLILGPDRQKMSKSRGNVIDPDEEVKKYGADTVRMFLAFMGPYEQGGPWDPRGINGVYRFLNRVWNLFNAKRETRNAKPEAKELEIKLNQAIKKIGKDIQTLSFNTGVSELMKLLNEFEKTPAFEIGNLKLEIFTKLLAPFAPHLAEELWMNVLGNKKSIHLENWPEYNEAIIAEEKINLVIQINGKMRDVITVRKGLPEEEIKQLAFASEKIKKHILEKPVKKIIFVKDKLTNIVI